MKKMIHISCMVQWHQSCCVEKLEDACALMASAGSSVRLPATPTAIVLPAPPVAVVTPQGHQQTDRGLDPTETLQSGDVKSPDRADGVAATLEDTVFPDTPQEVTADFLSRMTGRAVKGFQLEILGMGFVCDAHKATLEYEGTSGPSSVVLKMPKDDAGSREMNAPFFALEANWYRKIAAVCPIKCAPALGVFTDPGNPLRFLLVLENLNLVEGNEHNPGWLDGLPPDDIQLAIDDLARMHGKFFQSPLLDTLVPCHPTAGIPSTAYSGPIVGYALKAYAPFPGAAAAGFPEGTLPVDMLEPLLERMKDYLEWDYKVDGDDTLYRYPDGPWTYPDPKFRTQEGAAVVVKACEILGSRPRTLVHCDGHPGNTFVNKATGETTWLDFQVYSAGPPGLDLAQALSLGVLGATRESLRDMTRRYHRKLCEHGPAGLEDEYPFEMCWEDFLLGMIVWYPTGAMVHCLNLTTIQTDANGELKRRVLKTFVPRHLALIHDLNLYGIVDEILKR